MLYRILALFIIFVSGGLSLSAVVKDKLRVDTLVMNGVVEKYTTLLSDLVKDYDIKAKASDTVASGLSANYFRYFARPTLYKDPLKQVFEVEWQPSLPGRTLVFPAYLPMGDSLLTLYKEQNKVLMQTYVGNPWLVSATEEQLDKAGEVKEEIKPAAITHVQLAEKEMNIDLTPDIDEIYIQVRRPNFWSTSGDYSLQFTQSYFSENWYQGGENNYTMLALATMRANYDNKNKVQWENWLEMRLGFQTSQSDEIHKFKTNDDLLRFTTKIGYKAAKRWYYTLQVQASTQFYPSYKANSKDVSSDFMSPFNMTVSLGMDYKLELSRFKGSAVLTPVSYNFRYVDRENLRPNFGIEEGMKTYNYFGPSITVNYTWDIYKNIQWGARLYWFSNLEQTTVEWENTITFSLTRFLNAKLFLYPRYDDSSLNYRNEETGNYLMFKEWFSLGMNYNF